MLVKKKLENSKLYILCHLRWTKETNTSWNMSWCFNFSLKKYLFTLYIVGFKLLGTNSSWNLYDNKEAFQNQKQEAKFKTNIQWSCLELFNSEFISPKTKQNLRVSVFCSTNGKVFLKPNLQCKLIEKIY